MSQLLSVCIHHLNPWGGHDRSNLEILRRLSSDFDFEAHIHCFAFEDPKKDSEWGKKHIHLIRPHIRRPALAMQILFQSVVFLRHRLGKLKKPVLSVGTASWVSDWIQVQFIQSDWKELKNKTNQADKTRFVLRRFYRNLIDEYNVYLELRLYSNSRKFIAISNKIKADLQTRFGILESKIRVIHHGVDGQVFYPWSESPPGTDSRSLRQTIRSKFEINDQKIVLIFAGEFERKGLRTVLSALSLLDVRHQKELVLWIAGEGDAQKFQKLSSELNIHTPVIFLGKVKNIQDYYRASDAFVFPTLYEPFGLVILEALASGLPSFISKIAGASELVHHRTDAWLLENPENSTELADGIRWLLEHPLEASKMGEKARETALKHDWKSVAHKYSTILMGQNG